MNGIGTYTPRSMGPDDTLLAGSFMTNGTTTGALSATTNTFRAARGMKGFTVSYAATGVYTITLPAGISFPLQPWTVVVSPQAATLATDWFEVVVIGETTLATSTARQIVVQCHRNGTANAPSATAGNRINFWIVAGNNTGA